MDAGASMAHASDGGPLRAADGGTSAPPAKGSRSGDAGTGAGERLDAAALRDRWGPWLEGRFPGTLRAALDGDFDADGKADVAVVMADERFSPVDIFVAIFSAPVDHGEPDSWSVLRHLTAEPTAHDASWAAAQIAPLAGKLAPGQTVLAFGPQAPLIAYFDRQVGCYRFDVTIPNELEAAATHARAQMPRAFLGSPNGWFDCEATATGEPPPALQAFVGDFNASRKLDLVVINGKRLAIYLDGAATPVTQTITYPAVEVRLNHSTRASIVPFPETRQRADGEWESVERPPVEVRGDFLELLIPGVSSIALAWQRGTWREIWLSD
jgi:hypothetical protein